MDPCTILFSQLSCLSCSYFSYKLFSLPFQTRQCEKKILVFEHLVYLSVKNRLHLYLWSLLQLESIKWQLNLNMGQSMQSKLKDPTAVLEFGLKSGQNGIEDDNLRTINVEFDHKSLYKFYNQVCTIVASRRSACTKLKKSVVLLSFTLHNVFFQLELIQAHMDSLI